MILRVGERTFCGAVVDCRPATRGDGDPLADGSDRTTGGGDPTSDGGDCDESVGDADHPSVADAVVAALRGEPSACGAVCPAPGPVHERAGHVRPGMGLATRTAIAAAAQSRGLGAPQDEELAAVRRELATIERTERREWGEQGETAAPAVEDVERCRERVAALRGRVRTLEDGGRDASDERDELRAAAAELSEVATERVAAIQRRERARERRDRRERRLRLQDRSANLERAARSHLVDRLAGEYADAVADLGAGVDDPFDADAVTAALAVLRVADVRTPVALAVGRFADPSAAADWLDAPVVRL